MIVAIDGPGGSGKSTVARSVARRLGFTYIDSGAMYRAVALWAIRLGMDLDECRVPAAELLHSTDRLRELFRHMTKEYDLVVVDSSPVTLITDAQLLAENCDAVLLVARAFSTTRKSLEQTARELSAFRIVGTVLNGGTRAQLYRRYNGYY